jgi:hypothetical protein
MTEEKFHGLTIDRFIDADKLAADMKLDETDLNDGFLTQAGLVAYYGVLAARAAAQLVSVKVVRDTTEAKVANELRERAADLKEKITEASIERNLWLDPRVIAVHKAYALAIQIEGETRAATDAMKARRDMLIQLGAASREEAKGSVRMSVTSTAVSDRASELKARLSRKA